ncbi:transport and Golgi organization protein 6 homolog [Xenentodon cancila]
MTSRILSAVSILTRPLEVSVQSSKQEALLAALGTNTARLLEQLQSDSSFSDLQRLREQVMVTADWFCSDTEDATWSFVQELLLLLLTLKNYLDNELQCFKQAPPPAVTTHYIPEMAPPLPPDVLSVSQQKTLGAALQFVVSLGLSPYLAPGVGVSLVRRSAFGAVVEKVVRREVLPTVERRLLATTKALLQVAELSSLATLLFTRHMGDVMAALCQLGYQPHRDNERSLSADDCQTCREALRNLLGKVYQPIVIKELLILQGGPKQSGLVGSSSGSSSRMGLGSAPAWLRHRCGQLLSERLMQPHGVQAVVRAILEGGTGSESDWRKCDAVARILVACPQQSASADEYFKLICPQILDLMHFKDKLTAQQFQCVATRAVLSIVQERPTFAQQYLLGPLLAPLHRCITASSSCQVTVEESELTRCVEDVYKIWVLGNSSSKSVSTLLTKLQEVLPVIYTLFCFTKQNVCHLRGPCQEILLWYLSQTEKSAALSILRQLSGLKERTNDVSVDFHFTAGSDGGARLSSRDTWSNEEDEMYEKLSGEQWRLECLMQLLGELKDSDLPGDFFLDLFQELTSWTAVAEEEETDEEEVDMSSMTLLEGHMMGRAERQAQRLALLQVLAVMVECLQHTQLLRKTTQVVNFMVSLFGRACVGLDEVPRSGAGNPIESQMLSLGMSLVAIFLSAPQLSPGDYSSLSRLLPPLETLSQLHPDEVIQELASNLRAVIATHGAYRPENLAAAAAQCSRKTETAKSNSQVRKEETHSQTPVNPHNILSASSGAPLNGGQQISGHDPATKPFSDWLLEACDPNVPTRALALRILTQMVRDKEPEYIQAQDKVLMLFLENLEHEDSFVYLSAIQGLAALADSYPDQILDRLLKDFQHGPSLPSSDKERSLETRLKVGEVLMRASRAMGELAPHLGCPLLGAFLQGTRDPDQSVRASSLSNLGELCQRLDYALGPLAQELSSCLTALIKTEKEAEVRRAAVHVIALLLRGLSDKTTQVLSDVLLDLYRALKWVVHSDPDQVAVLHAQVALEELDDVMRRFLFPEQKLEKKIVVLP